MSSPAQLFHNLSKVDIGGRCSTYHVCFLSMFYDTYERFITSKRPEFTNNHVQSSNEFFCLRYGYTHLNTVYFKVRHVVHQIFRYPFLIECQIRFHEVRDFLQIRSFFQKYLRHLYIPGGGRGVKKVSSILIQRYHEESRFYGIYLQSLIYEQFHHHRYGGSQFLDSPDSVNVLVLRFRMVVIDRDIGFVQEPSDFFPHSPRTGSIN